jgi:NADH:ubiquinone oxidoreductase subunit
MGSDGAGNRYYENRVDYPFGQHRWVEPGDINNFDSSSIPPEWHGWMTSMNDCTPSTEEAFIEEKKAHLVFSETSNAPDSNNVGHQEPYFNFHQMHNQSQIRSRGYNIGNPIVGLPPGAPDAYYTQPGSPYNPGSIRPLEFIGDLDADKGGGRPYKSEKWAARLMTSEEKAKIQMEKEALAKKLMVSEQERRRHRLLLARSRGSGTVVR